MNIEALQDILKSEDIFLESKDGDILKIMFVYVDEHREISFLVEKDLIIDEDGVCEIDVKEISFLSKKDIADKTTSSDHVSFFDKVSFPKYGAEDLALYDILHNTLIETLFEIEKVSILLSVDFLTSTRFKKSDAMFYCENGLTNYGSLPFVGYFYKKHKRKIEDYLSTYVSNKTDKTLLLYFLEKLETTLNLTTAINSLKYENRKISIRSYLDIIIQYEASEIEIGCLSSFRKHLNSYF
jgi:hypothetical protein